MTHPVTPPLHLPPSCVVYNVVQCSYSLVPIATHRLGFQAPYAISSTCIILDPPWYSLNWKMSKVNQEFKYLRVQSSNRRIYCTISSKCIQTRLDISKYLHVGLRLDETCTQCCTFYCAVLPPFEEGGTGFPLASTSYPHILHFLKTKNSVTKKVHYLRPIIE